MGDAAAILDFARFCKSRVKFTLAQLKSFYYVCVKHYVRSGVFVLSVNIFSIRHLSNQHTARQ